MAAEAGEFVVAVGAEEFRGEPVAEVLVVPAPLGAHGFDFGGIVFIDAGLQGLEGSFDGGMVANGGVGDGEGESGGTEAGIGLLIPDGGGDEFGGGLAAGRERVSSRRRGADGGDGGLIGEQPLGAVDPESFFHRAAVAGGHAGEQRGGVEVGIVVEDLGGGPGEEPVAAILFHLGGGTEVFRELGFVFAEVGEEDAEEGVLLLFGFGEVPAGAGEEFEDGVDEFDAAFRFVGAALDLFD